jgi:hypothetical protein
MMRLASLLKLKVLPGFNMFFPFVSIMYRHPETSTTDLNLPKYHMFNLNKIRGHIKMLEFEKLKLTRYQEEAVRLEPRNTKREADIERALRRVQGGIDMWTQKLEAITAAPPRPADRGAIGSDDPNRPLVG